MLFTYQSIKNNSWFKDFKWDELTNLNLKAPYIPIIPESNFDFDEKCKPKFDLGNNKFREYTDYIKENTKQIENKENKETNISQDQKDRYTKLYNNF